MMSADSQEPTSHGDPKLMQPAARSAVPRTYIYVYMYIDLTCVCVCVCAARCEERGTKDLYVYV
jgi:hypothetical protein